MSAPAWLLPHLGYRPGGRGKPNISDSDNAPSVAVSREMFRLAGVAPRAVPSPPRPFEDDLARSLRGGLGRLGATSPFARTLTVRTEASIGRYAQFDHLDRLQRLIEADTADLLSVEVGRDYEIIADVVVERSPAVVPSLPPRVRRDLLNQWPTTAQYPPPILTTSSSFLHAVISLKWTLRSDRGQNARHEAVTMIRHRRGRLPHVVVATLEPLPGRLASIARGTGELDAVYHLMFDELWEAVQLHGTAYQKRVLRELVSQRRLLPWGWLAPTISAD